MTALSLQPAPQQSAKRSDHSRRLNELRSEASHIRVMLKEGKLSSEEAAEMLEKLAKRHRTFLNRILDL